MKQNIAKALSNKISEVLREYQNEQIEYKTSLKEKISRQAKLVDPNISKDKMDDLMNDPQVFFINLHQFVYMFIYITINL